MGYCVRDAVHGWVQPSRSSRSSGLVVEPVQRRSATICTRGAAGIFQGFATSGPAPNSQPDVSADGHKILFVSLRQMPGSSRNYDIWEKNIDGTGERRLTTSPRGEESPRYAPDGRSFYYLRDEGGSPLTKRVYRQDLVSGVATPITPPGLFVQAFSVSADGATIALVTLAADANGVQTARLVTFNVASGETTPVVLPGADRILGPAFRPATPPH